MVTMVHKSIGLLVLVCEVWSSSNNWKDPHSASLKNLIKLTHEEFKMDSANPDAHFLIRPGSVRFNDGASGG